MSVFATVRNLLDLDANSQGKYSAYYVLLSELDRLDPSPYTGNNPWRDLLVALAAYGSTTFIRELAAEIGVRAQ